MKLIIIVVEDDDAPNLIRELSAEGYSSTKLASTGGFLLHGNTTLLVGVKDEQVDPVIDIVKRICVRRKKSFLRQRQRFQLQFICQLKSKLAELFCSLLM